MQPDPTHPGPHPEPVSDLASRELPIRAIDQPWYRVHRTDRDPLFFGRTGRNRFDAPGGEYGVLYVGEDPFCAFVESFEPPTIYKPLTHAVLASRSFSTIQVNRPLQLVDLTGAGLARIGADERLAAGDHAIARRWSYALWSHPSQPDGLMYRARHDPARISAALFDRIEEGCRISQSLNLDDPGQWRFVASILDEYGYTMVDPTYSETDAYESDDRDGRHSKSPSSG